MRKTVFALAIILMATLASPVAATFVDVPANHWAYDYVNYAEAAGIMSGVGDGYFKPDSTISMAEVCQIIYNMSSGTKATTTGGPWYKDALSYVRNKTGFQIDPDVFCTRIFVCHLIYRLEGGSPVASYSGASYFPDISNEGAEARKAVAYCVERGIIGGREDGNFHAYDYLSRAEAAKVFVIYGASKAAVAGTKAIAKLAESLGLYAEIKDHPDTRVGYSWRDILVYTPQGYYTYTYGGTLTEQSWVVQTAENVFEPVDTDFVEQWIKTTADKYSPEQKIAVAKEQLIAHLEALDLFPEITVSSDTSFRFEPFGGLETSDLPQKLSSPTSYRRAVSLSRNGLVVQGNVVVTFSEYLEEITAISKRLTPDEKAELAAKWIKNWAVKNGWKAEITKRDNGNWYQVKCYPNLSSPYYLFVVGGTDSLEWYSENSGVQTKIVRESVKLVIKK